MALEHTKLLHADLSKQIIGAAMEVHSTLGAGFLKSVYEEALAYEFALRNMCFERQKTIDVYYKGQKVKHLVCDFLVAETILVELKAIKAITEVEQAQVLNYLKATGLEVGLLLNFAAKSLDFKRFVKSNPRNP